MRRKLISLVEKQYNGMRLDYWLSSRFTYHSRNCWQKLISTGEVLVNDKKTKASKILYEGNTVELKTNQDNEPEANTNIEIIYEDDYLIAVNKPADLPCHPSGAYFHNTLWYMVFSQVQKKVHIVHRLDRETSGIVVLAKNGEIAKELSHLFNEKLVKKTYVAAVHGNFPDYLETLGYLEKDKDSKLLKKRKFIELTKEEYKNSKTPEKAETNFELLVNLNSISLVKAMPKTGRFHQIRATLYSMGYPLVGDKTYGLDENFFLKFISDQLTEDDFKTMILDRQALHSKTLEFYLPSIDKHYSFETDVPEEIKKLFL